MYLLATKNTFGQQTFYRNRDMRERDSNEAREEPRETEREVQVERQREQEGDLKKDKKKFNSILFVFYVSRRGWDRVQSFINSNGWDGSRKTCWKEVLFLHSI